MKKLLIGICMLSPALLFAQGFQVNLQGQKQQAMGGAGVATNLDAAIFFYNPGSISYLEGNSISACISLTSGNTAFRDENSQQTVPYQLAVGWSKRNNHDKSTNLTK